MAIKVAERLDEFSLIEKYFAPIAGKGAFALKDDAALFSPGEGMECVITQDAVAEGVHFFPEDPPEMVAAKALRVNLSDLAAKGARPSRFSVALGLSEDWSEEWVAGFARGLSHDAKVYEVELTGGDTFMTGGGTVISITALGEVKSGNYTARFGASPGDLVYVTGTIGDAALGLAVRSGRLEISSRENHSYLEDRYLLPQPRCALAEAIGKFASASIDVSDGFAADFGKLCQASQLVCSLPVSRIPLSDAAADAVSVDPALIQTILGGGDDYEIIVAVPPENRDSFENAANKQDFQTTAIGELMAGKTGLLITDENDEPLLIENAGYSHL